MVALVWRLSNFDPSEAETSDYICCYAPMAQTFLKGQLPEMEQRVLPIGYPALLAPWFIAAQSLRLPFEWGAAGLTLLCYGLSSVVIFALAELFWEQARAIGVAMVWVCLPPLLWLTRGQNSEIPFIFFSYLSLYFFWRAMLSRDEPARDYFLSGILVGAAMLIRGIGVGLGVVLALVLLLVARERTIGSRLVMAGILLAGNLVAVLPWEIAAYQNTNRIIAITTNDAASMRDGLTFGVESKGYRAGLNLPPDVLALMKSAQARKMELTTPGTIFEFLRAQMQEHPRAVVELLLIKLARSLYGTDSQRYEILFLAFQIPYLLLVAFGAYYAARRNPNRSRLLVSLIVLTFYFWGMTLLVLPIVRYMTPVLALGCLMLPGVLLWMQEIRDRFSMGVTRAEGK